MSGAEITALIEKLAAGLVVILGAIGVFVWRVVKSKNAAQKSEADTMSQAMADQIKHLQDVIALSDRANKTITDNLTSQVNAFSQSLVTTQKENLELHKGIENIRREKTMLELRLTKQIEDLTKDNQELRKIIEQRDGIISEQARQIVELQSEVATWKAKYTDQEQALISLRHELAQVKAKTGPLGGDC